MEGQGQFLPEPEPNVAGMPDEPAKAGWPAGQAGELVRTSDSQGPPMVVSLVLGDADWERGQGSQATDTLAPLSGLAGGIFICSR